MRICQLDGAEAKMLEEFGVRPDCNRHLHLRCEEAAQRIENKTYRYVGTKKRAVTRCSYATGEFYDLVDCSKRAWKVKRSGQRSGWFAAVQLTHDARRLGRS